MSEKIASSPTRANGRSTRGESSAEGPRLSPKAGIRGVGIRGAGIRGVGIRGAEIRGAEIRDAGIRGSRICGSRICGSRCSVGSMARSMLTVDSFAASHGEALRDHFDERFAEPRRARGDRFVWDYWHVSGQYTALRTPAYTFFPSSLYRRFHEELVWWGRRTLGCHDISPPWLSVYVEGCRQELHGDLPHGPWAFVYSLTHWRKRQFRGGQTLLLREEVLDYWRDFQSERGVEEPQLVQEIEPRFSRLVVFDPRRPHGVRRVEGTHDPRHGRLVIHGWFVQPRPFVEGPLPARAAKPAIEAATEAIAPFLESGLPISGMLSIRLTVASTGDVKRAELLSDTTRVAGEWDKERKSMVRAVTNQLARVHFSRAKGPSTITLPLVFARE